MDRKSQMMGGARRTAMRIMHRKSQGIVAVYEQDPAVTSSNSRSLIFETPKMCTRLEQFPADWQLMSDDALAAIPKKEQH